MTESGVLLIAAAAVIVVCAAPVLYVLWRDRSRIWSLEQRLSQLEAVQDGVARLDRVARLEGQFERVMMRLSVWRGWRPSQSVSRLWRTG